MNGQQSLTSQTYIKRCFKGNSYSNGRRKYLHFYINILVCSSTYTYTHGLADFPRTMRRFLDHPINAYVSTRFGFSPINGCVGHHWSMQGASIEYCMEVLSYTPVSKPGGGTINYWACWQSTAQLCKEGKHNILCARLNQLDYLLLFVFNIHEALLVCDVVFVFP